MNTTIKDCKFYGVKWEEDAIEVLQTVAQGLLNLTELFKAQNIVIEAMIKVDKSPEVD